MLKNVGTLKLEGRNFGYHSFSLSLWRQVFVWFGLSRWLSSWAIGFGFLRASILLYLGPVVIGFGLIHFARSQDGQISSSRTDQSDEDHVDA